MDTKRQRSLLFLDKVFLRPRKQNLRGVELFNLGLIQDLSREGFSLTIPIHYSWKDDFKHEPSSCPPFFARKPCGPACNAMRSIAGRLPQGGSSVAPKELWQDKMAFLASVFAKATPDKSQGSAKMPRGFRRRPGGYGGQVPRGASLVFREVSGHVTLFNGLIAAWRLRRQQYHKIILANVANSLIPALFLLRIFNRPLPLIVFAHRMPSARFMAALPKKITRVICVNSIIAAEFKKSGFRDVNVLFGHMNADKFHPDEETKQKRQISPSSDGAEKTRNKVNFCVVGFLDNAWKGADTAVAAFRAMSKDISVKCVLHLASYRLPLSFPEQNIRAYDWLPTGEMPQWLRQMDVMIVPSRDEHVMRETFSLTMIEGMLTELPIIASNLPVLAEKLDAGGGYVFKSTEELSRLMADLASNPELRAELGKKARQIALSRYVWNTKTFVNRYLV